ncbi:nitroreductase family protein [Ilumatobacter sp.]|uniref:nitroreductase family protein n=1 Tax=Ilumatobacter sp. TaxID=1967498 RepID=UPI003B51D71B
MEFMEVVRRRRTTNGALDPRPVAAADQRTLVEVAGMAPSHFNSQPWRFVLIDDRELIDTIAEWSGESMTTVFREGRFFRRYRRHFRFSAEEMERHRSGILFDRMPAVLRPFTRYVFTDRATSVMNRLGVPERLGADNRDLVAGAPLILAVLLDRTEYVPGELSGFYSVFGMGAAVENIWLATVELGMGIQFISFPMEVPERWAAIVDLLEVPDGLELMAMYRLGYLPDDERRPSIDWSSRERLRIGDYVFRNTCRTPESGAPDEDAPGEGSP